MENPLLSIIVTVCNLEKYLSACLDSILAQSGCDFEVVLVNNNSTDKSGEICSDYAGRHSQIQYFFLDGEAVMWRAHRYGLEKACGNYIWFVDGDDLLAEDACEALVKAINETRADVLFGRFNTFLEGSVANFADSPYECAFVNGQCKNEALEYLITTQQPVLPTWRLIFSIELYRNAILKEKFFHLMCNAHQDTGFNVLILLSARIIHYIDRPIYNYRVREASVSRTAPDIKILAYCKALLTLSYLGHSLAKSKSERGFVKAYYNQFIFLLSTAIGTINSEWGQGLCDDVNEYARAIGICRDTAFVRDFALADKIFSQGTVAALDAQKLYYQKKMEQLASLVKAKGGSVYIAPTGNVGIFLKTSLEQHGAVISGFFDNDNAKDGMEIAGVLVQNPSVAAELRYPVTILICASYASVPRQLKEQFISIGVPESELIIIEF